MARAGRIRDRVNYQAAMSSEQAAQRRAGSEQVADGAGGFTPGPNSPTQQYTERNFSIGPGRGANTKGSVAASQQTSRDNYKPKSQSVRQPSRLVRGYRG
jgi:hypothetical protein